MAGFDGAGTFVRSYNWTNDANNNIKIRADRMDTEDNGFATGLSTCICKDGQTVITAHIPFNSKKITGLGSGTARTDAMNLGQLQDAGAIYTVTTGSADAYISTPTPAITAYATGQMFLIKANFSNTGAATINVSGVGAQALKKNGTTALAANDIRSGYVYLIIYDGTNFQVINLNIYNLTTLGTLTATGALVASSTLDVTGASTFNNSQITGGVIAYNAQVGTTYTLAASDNGKIVTLNNGSAITLTLPQQSTTTLAAGFSCIIRQLGAGQVTVALQGTDTLVAKNSATKLIGQYSEAQIDLPTAASPNVWFMAGDITT